MTDIRNIKGYENLIQILGEEMCNAIYQMQEENIMLSELKERYENSLGKYSDYLSLTLDGMEPEEAYRDIFN